MATGVLGLGSDGAASLNQSVIDDLKAAEKKAYIDPIDKKLETWAEEDEKMTEIKTKSLELLSGIKSFDLYASGGNIFEQMGATTTGTAATFNANDTSGLNPGTTSVNITQLAQRDVYQTSTFSDASQQIDGGNDTGDMLTVEVSGSPLYQSTTMSTTTSTDKVGAGEFTITAAGGSAVTFTTDADTTWDDLQQMIHADSNFKANIVNNRISISSTDGDKELTISDTSGSVSSDLGLTRGRKFSTVGQTYDQLAAAINYDGKLTSSVEQVGDESYRLVIKSSDTGETNQLTINETNIDFGFGDVSSDSIADFTALMGAGRITINGDTVVADTEFMSYDDLINEITTYGGGGTYTATKVDGKIEIKANDGSNITVVEDGNNGLNFQDQSKLLSAQNLNATIDGVAYNTSSNTINTQGNLAITAASIGDASITLTRDTSSLETSLNTFLTSYNELVDLVNAELNEIESPIENKSSLRTMMTQIKDMIFGYYGENNDQNIFEHGLSLDTTGHITLDSAKFSESIANNFDNLKLLFIGTAADEGLGTQLKTYIDSLDAYEGLLSNYDSDMMTRYDTLTEEQEEETKKLDDKYLQMAMQFAEYGAIINQMEAQFGGLKMMIEQSTSG